MPAEVDQPAGTNIEPNEFRHMVRELRPWWGTAAKLLGAIALAIWGYWTSVTGALAGSSREVYLAWFVVMLATVLGFTVYRRIFPRPTARVWSLEGLQHRRVKAVHHCCVNEDAVVACPGFRSKEMEEIRRVLKSFGVAGLAPYDEMRIFWVLARWEHTIPPRIFPSPRRERAIWHEIGVELQSSLIRSKQGAGVDPFAIADALVHIRPVWSPEDHNGSFTRTEYTIYLD